MKKNLCIAFSCLVIFILCLLLATQIIKPPVDFGKLSDKYQYVYKIMATKPVDSEVCLIAELVSDKDAYYCDNRALYIGLFIKFIHHRTPIKPYQLSFHRRYL